MVAVYGIYGGKVVSVTGGVLVRDTGWSVIGELGVTGHTSDNDLVAAFAGIDAASLFG